MLRLRNRVLARYWQIGCCNVVWLHFRIVFEANATNADLVWDVQAEAWKARLAGGAERASGRFDAAHGLVRIRGYRYFVCKDCNLQPSINPDL